MLPPARETWITALTVSSINFADMAAFHAADTGTEKAWLPWETPITAFQTVQGSLHRLSFHEPGDPMAEPTNGHTLVLGKSGGGKTTTVAFLAAQAQRAGGRTIIFDKEAGLTMAVHAIGRHYAKVRAGRATGLKPLATEAGERGKAWLLDWLVALVETRSGPMTPLQSEALKSAIVQNGKTRQGLRNFQSFQELFGDVGDGLDLAQRLREWVPDGRYGWVFGEASEPVVEFTHNDSFHLTYGELDFVLSPIRGQRLVLSRSPRGSTVLNVDLKALGPLLTALGGGQAGLNASGSGYTAQPKFWKE